MPGGGGGTGAVAPRPVAEGADLQPMTAQPPFSSQHSL
jgi:hypothetical protein